MRSTRLACLLVASVCLVAVGQTPLQVKGLTPNAPLTISAKATAARLFIDVKMNPEWHLYAEDVGGGQPVSVALPKTGGFEPAGKLVIPTTADGKLKGSFRLELPIRPRADAGPLKATFEFMACDPLMCLPPMSVQLKGSIGGGASVKVLLAVDVEDERSKRLSAFLGENGFVTTVRTFVAATKEECDAHDVVLFDSKLFRKSIRGARQQAHAFPKTKTPIVAVGFLGTELIEAHGLAMTSGYI